MAGFLTDGYFANRPPPGPSRLDVKTARDDDQNSAMSSPRSFVTRRSMDSPELEPLLLDRSAPPPAYSPSPPLQHLLYQGIASQSQQQYNGYGAMSNTPFFEAGQPQSMAPAVVSPTVALLTEDGSEGQARKRRKRYRCRQSLCRRLAKFMLVLSIVLVVCSVVWKVARSTSGSNKHIDDSPTVPSLPEATPAAPDNPAQTQPTAPGKTTPTIPGVPKQPNTGKPDNTVPGDPLTPKRPTEDIGSWPSCLSAAYPWAVTFDNFEQTESLTIHENIQTSLASITGDIRFVPGPYDQKSNYHISVTAGSSEPSILQLFRIHLVNTTLTMSFSNSADDEGSDFQNANPIRTILEKFWKLFDTSFPNFGLRPCIVVRATVYVSPRTQLEHLDITSCHLSVDLGQGLSLKVANQTTISTTSGNVKILEADSFMSRRTVIDVHSGSIQGDYALLDLLSLQASSGSIQVNVFPKEADRRYPAPAEFRATSSSGRVEVHYPIHGLLPHRDYTVFVDAASGSVSGDYPLGLQMQLSSQSGSITARVLPYATANHISTLSTNSKSGQTSLEVLKPRDRHSHSIQRMMSRHESQSGAINLRYPLMWAGDIMAETSSSHIILSGPDITELERHKYAAGEYLRAQKGYHGLSSMSASAKSGSLNIWFADL